ncbi:MAG: 30S ribosomal protein S17 [Candidatus Woesebacteria bacterium]|jgi:small subunit ribosomal protein S17
MKVFTGEVISTKMAKTATVVVDRVVKHPVYKKHYKVSKKYHVHDDIGVKVGQKVKFVSSKPHSKLKRWEIIEVEGKEPGTASGKEAKKASARKGNKK